MGKEEFAKGRAMHANIDVLTIKIDYPFSLSSRVDTFK